MNQSRRALSWAALRSLVLALSLLAGGCAPEVHPFHVMQTRTESQQAESVARESVKLAEQCQLQQQTLEKDLTTMRRVVAEAETTAASCERLK